MQFIALAWPSRTKRVPQERHLVKVSKARKRKNLFLHFLAEAKDAKDLNLDGGSGLPWRCSVNYLIAGAITPLY